MPENCALKTVTGCCMIRTGEEEAPVRFCAEGEGL